MDAARLIPLHEAMMEFKRKVVLDAEQRAGLP